MTVLLDNGTVGQVLLSYKETCKVGSWVKVGLYDENGNFLDDSGIVQEILED